MKNERPLTSEGKRIKKALIDLGMSQAEFCRVYGIQTQRLSDIMHTDYNTYKAVKVRLLVYKTLRELGAIQSYPDNIFGEVSDA